MKPVLNWIKMNPILLVAAVLCISSLGALAYVHLQGQSFKAKVLSREANIREIQGYMKTTIQLPAPKLDDDPVSIQCTITPQVIDVIRKVYGEMDKEYRSIFQKAVEFNLHGSDPDIAHYPMREGLFPDPGDQTHRLFEARMRYREAFLDMVKDYSSSAQYPRLDAGGPMPLTDLSEDLYRVQEEFLTSGVITKSINSLSDEEYEELEKRKTMRALETMRRYASRIHIYADTDSRSPGFPFEIGAWSNKPQAPHMVEVWEGQMSLWLQQDIVQAIALTNRVSDPESNVITAPIKRLMHISVGNQYVGIDLNANLSAAAMGGGGAAAAAGDGKLVANYTLSPTGRTSNEIYDVRHIRIEMIADWHRLGEFMTNLARTNFMTVLQVNIEDVDEYQAIREGYLYGVGDAVKVDMIVESLWLRDWTAKLMPKIVRKALGVPDDAPAGGAEGTTVK